MVPVSVQGQHPCTLRGLQASLPFFLGLITSAASSHSAPSSSSMLDTFPLLCSVLVSPQIATGLSLSPSQMLVPISLSLKAVLTTPRNPVHLFTQNSQHALLCSNHIFFSSSYHFQYYWKMYSSYISLAHPFHRYINSSSGAGTFAWHPEYLEQGLAFGSHVISICWMNEQNFLIGLNWQLLTH